MGSAWLPRSNSTTAAATASSTASVASALIPRPSRSLPLDRARRLAGDVQHHAVHLRDLIDHARGDPLQQVVREAGPVGGHRVVARDGAEHDHVAVAALVALYADCPQAGREDAERLPQLAVQPGRADLVLKHEVRVAKQLESLLRDLAAHHPDGQPGPRERLAPHQPLGQSELSPDRADLVLEERTKRLHELEAEVLGQPADVVVRLDRGGPVPSARLDHVGVERSLNEEAGVPELTRLLFEHADELLADDLPL